MAKVTGSPFGRVLGESLGVVGGQWKGIDYVRRYVVPANPNTAGQQLQRAKFKNISDFGRRIVDTVLNPYTLPKPKQQSAFNKFISVNVPLQTTDTLDYLPIKVVTGSLYFAHNNYQYPTDGSTLTVAWQTTLIGEANANDVVRIAIYNPSLDSWVYSNGLRSEAGKNLSLGYTVAVGQTVWAYLFAVGVNGDKTSDSVVIECLRA